MTSAAAQSGHVSLTSEDGWDSFVRIATERFLACYQALEITVRHPGTVHASTVHVHVPYMMGSATWVNHPETLSRQRPRHRARLGRLYRARRQASPELQAVFRRWLYDSDGEERLVAAGRSGPEEIRELLHSEATFEFEASVWEQQSVIARNRKLAAFCKNHTPRKEQR
jgi:hypothetical protein